MALNHCLRYDASRSDEHFRSNGGTTLQLANHGNVAQGVQPVASQPKKRLVDSTLATVNLVENQNIKP
ncbi:MAG: hypothetical protein CL484_06280 [Acidobacteria bacterium]|nr:hypothetical protein [Acidobacteriota bacterium]